jgi:tRNA nucleotidyltransferase (CCA-adding enzyme)
MILLPWRLISSLKRTSRNIGDYIKEHGFDYEEHQVMTDDGYRLVLYQLVQNQEETTQKSKHPTPVLIQHGLFQSAGVFVSSGSMSLAFWLSKQG